MLSLSDFIKGLSLGNVVNIHTENELFPKWHITLTFQNAATFI